jgi:integrase
LYTGFATDVAKIKIRRIKKMLTRKNVGVYAPTLPPELEKLLADYAQHCRRNGLREGSVTLYEKEGRWFLRNLADNGCEKSMQITAGKVVTACLSLTSKSYLSTARTFLRYCADCGKTDRDYSYVIPSYKRPQPMPTVYSEDEILRMETAINRSTPAGKRDYAIVLLATRLGLRLEDIRTLSFNELDFEGDSIRLVQEKTLAAIVPPMVPELKAALLDYIENARPNVAGLVFRNSYPPYQQMSKTGIDACFFRAFRKAKIERGGRGRGPRALRSSLASSMVNDGIPYEAVRKTLGHIDPNAISHYAKLDIRQLRLYALPVPATVGAFDSFLAGKELSL